MALQATDGDEGPSGVRPSGLPPGFRPAPRQADDSTAGQLP